MRASAHAARDHRPSGHASQGMCPPVLDRFGEACELLPEPVALVERLVTVAVPRDDPVRGAQTRDVPLAQQPFRIQHRVHAESNEGGVLLRLA